MEMAVEVEESAVERLAACRLHLASTSTSTPPRPKFQLDALATACLSAATVSVASVSVSVSEYLYLCLSVPTTHRRQLQKHRTSALTRREISDLIIDLIFKMCIIILQLTCF